MSPQEALNIVAQLIALAPTTFANHQMGQQALQVLAEAVKPKEKNGK